MKHLPRTVRGTHDDARGQGYLVTLPDGLEEWHRLAWQATARAHGWVPPIVAARVQGERDRLREALDAARLHVEVAAQASHFLDGFRRAPATVEDRLLQEIDAALALHPDKEPT